MAYTVKFNNDLYYVGVNSNPNIIDGEDTNILTLYACMSTPLIEHYGGIDEIIIDEGIERLENGAFTVSDSGINGETSPTTVNYIYLPSTLTYIDDYAFNNVSINTLLVPSSVEYFGPLWLHNDFQCYNLIFMGDDAPEIPNDVIDDGVIRNIFVPNGSIEKYKEAWPNYANRINPMSALCKFERWTTYESTDNGVIWTPISHRKGDLLEVNSPECGMGLGIQYIRVVADGTYCVGTDKHERLVREVSSDNVNFSKTDDEYLGGLIESDCEECKELIKESMLTLIGEGQPNTFILCNRYNRLQTPIGEKHSLGVTEIVFGDCFGGFDSATPLFRYFDSLKEIRIPRDSSVSENIFRENFSIEHVYVGSGVTFFGENQFSDMPKLSSIEFEDGNYNLTLEPNMFENSTNLCDVRLPKNAVLTLQEGVFTNCNSLTSLTISNTNVNHFVFTAIPKTLRFIFFKSRSFQRISNRLLGDYPVFCYCDVVGLYELYQENNFIDIAHKIYCVDEGVPSEIWCYEGDINYERKYVYDGNDIVRTDEVREVIPRYKVKYLLDDGNTYYVDCNDSTILENGEIKYYDRPTGNYSNELLEAEIGVCVTEISTYAFYGCGNLTKIVFGENLKVIQYAAFSDSTSLEELELNDGLEEIGDSAFSSQRNLSAVSIPDSVARIGNNAFANFSKDIEITIGSGITSIGEQAFYRNSISNHKSVKIKAKTPPTIGVRAFDGWTTMTYPIYVPSESVDAYKQAWPQYSSRIIGY